jgi:hypothetical protein
VVLSLVPVAQCADQEPFFAAKSELTRAQRRRLLGGDPAADDGEGATRAESDDIELALEHGRLSLPKAGQVLCATQSGVFDASATGDGVRAVRAVEP